VSGVILLLFTAGLLFMVAGWRLRQASGVPAGRITYSDTDAPAQPLLSRRYGLVGKPDYIVIQRGVAIPVEVKPNRSADHPYDSDRLQVAAYCLLLEDANAKAPPFGVLRYRDRTFQIDYTPDLRAYLLELLDEMRSCLGAADVERSHSSRERCSGCGFSRSCEQSLAT
jgi:CRISPR-associated exonuclease Cas4